MRGLSCRVTLVVLLATITLLSLVPPAMRPVTAAPHHVEHLLVFAGAGITLGLGYSLRWWTQAATLALFAGAIETAQFFVPGRHARLSDLVVNIAGAWLGLAIAHGMARFSRPASGSASADLSARGHR